jgi:TolA-binding protein
MKISPILIAGITVTLVTGCGTSTPSQRGTLAELQNIEPDVKEVYLEDSLEMAAESYRRYLDETPEGELTPEAMRRLADLQIEQQYGVLGTGELIEMEAPESAPPVAVRESRQKVAVASEPGESEQAFEQRATQRQELLAASPEFQGALPTGHDDQIPPGPREAIETYKKILENYPNYERNDQVLYQMSRAYDEIGQPDEAMLVMDRFITEYKYSKYVDEVHFRRGEYFFVRKKYRDAEEAYAPILQLGAESSYYELAL